MQELSGAMDMFCEKGCSRLLSILSKTQGKVVLVNSSLLKVKQCQLG